MEGLGFVGGAGIRAGSQFEKGVSIRKSHGRRCASGFRPVRMVLSTEKTSDQEQKEAETRLISSTPEWKELQRHAKEEIAGTKLKDLLMDSERNDSMMVQYDDIYLDFSRQRANQKTMKLLYALADRAGLKQKIHDMVTGKKINTTEDRAVLHTALRAARDSKVIVDGKNAVDEVYGVLDRIKKFTDMVRSGEHRGATGKKIVNFVACGIGGSYLGPDFVFEAMKTDPEAANAAGERHLRFLANVDPVDVKRATMELDAEETMVIIISKTFTTRETMVNAVTIKDWLISHMGDSPEVVSKHMVACSSSVDKAEEFGIDPRNVFGFWDWVGGRYSVCSAVGAVPLSLQFGFDVFEKFLRGARSIDEHFASAPLEKNLPILMGLIGVWNMSHLDFKTRAMHPYTEALVKFPAHIQQVDMESNGKHVTIHGEEMDFEVGEIDWGEPGTNGQHSFFQLLHMGQVVPCDFIGFCESQFPICESGLPVSNHDELMANFFAQPDALANGKDAAQLKEEGVPEWLIPHKTFTGNRPSLSLLLPVLNAYTTGQLLALYEHRTAVEGFIWDLNSFDQWGVELGKSLATKVRKQINKTRYYDEDIVGFNSSTTNLLNVYLHGSVGCTFDEEPEQEL